MERLSKMAERLRVAVLSVPHFLKSNTSTKALHRFIDSIAFTAASRASFASIEDPDDPNRRLFLHAKNNLAAPPQGLAFTLEQSIVGDTGIVASRIVWETEPVDISADAAIAASQQMKRNVVYVLTTLKIAPIRSRR